MTTVGATLTKEQTADLQAVFQALDKDGSGQVSAGELLPALQTIQASTTMEEAKALMHDVDIDASGQISWEEFIRVMEKALSESTSEAQMFELIDTNGTGFISPSELRKALSEFNMDPSDQVVDEMLRSVDLDGDGVISLAEFKKALAP